MSSTELEVIDRILDELDQLANSDVDADQFFATLLERLRSLLQVDYSAILLPSQSAPETISWLVAAERGNVSPSLKQNILDDLSNTKSTVRESNNWLCEFISAGQPEKGVLCVAAQDRFQAGILRSELSEILGAFAEIIVSKQRYELEQFLDHKWPQVRQLSEQIASSTQQTEANSNLVNTLRRTCDAIRVSLISKSKWGTPRVVAVSGTPEIDATSPVVRSILTAGQVVFDNNNTTLNELPEAKSGVQFELSQSISPYHLPVPLRRHTASEQISQSPIRDVLVVEYPDRPQLLGARSRIQQIVGTVECLWDRQRDWLKLPKLLRMGSRRAAKPMTILRQVAKYGVCIGLFFVAVWFTFRPTPLRVEATGVYEPQFERTVFATNDGILVQLHVEEGSVVESGDILAEIRSPAIELRMEELQGELSSVNEEAASLNIAINQLDSSTLDLARTQVSMATKIKELNTRKSSLEKQIGILEIQLQELSLTAPISGVVVGKNLTQQLAARPVSRGVALFKVVDLEGPWHLRLQVNERDILYALGDLRDSSLPPDATNKVEFSFDRSPKDKYTAEVYRLADRVENIHGDGNFAEVLANPLAESHSSGYSGTGVHAYFDCGEYPTWFVWGRPIVEALQRRFWLPSSVADQRSNPIGKSS